jgi:hypothetical protein
VNLTPCTILKNGQDARSTKNDFSCGVGILPARKRLIKKRKKREKKVRGRTLQIKH